MKKTKKQIQKEQTILRNAYAEVAQQTGALDRVVKLMSANYLLVSHSAILVDEIEEILESHNLTPMKLKSASKKLMEASSDYFKEYSKLISQDQTVNWANDLVEFGEIFSEFTGISQEWEPATENVNIEEIENKYSVKLSINQAERH